MKCIAVDDEPLALDLISDYITRTPFLVLEEKFSNPFKALTYLLNNQVDLLFLDINLPELSGLQLLKSLPFKPKVVFTTAYSEYGAESYEYDAIDYLIKPIRYERFLKAVNKAAEQVILKKSERNIADIPVANSDSVMIKSGTQLFKIKLDQILYIEGAGNYMTFFTTDKKILSLLTMKDVLNLLPADRFIRIHKSYIVAFNHIDIVENHRVIIKSKAIPIGITYRQQFLLRSKENR
jgi:two-component system, LytTR family, response regulator